MLSGSSSRVTARRLKPELQLLRSVDHDPVHHPAPRQRPRSAPATRPAGPAARTAGSRAARRAARPAPRGRRRSPRAQSSCASRPSRRFFSASRTRYCCVDHLQLAVARLLEAVAVAARLQRGPELGRRRVLRHQLAEQPVEGADEVLGPLEPAEDVAAELAKHAAEDHRPLEVVARLRGRWRRGGRAAPGRCRAAGRASRGGRGRWRDGSGRPGDRPGGGPAGRAATGTVPCAPADERAQECLRGALEEQERVAGDDDLDRAGGEQKRLPGLMWMWRWLKVARRPGVHKVGGGCDRGLVRARTELVATTDGVNRYQDRRRVTLPPSDRPEQLLEAEHKRLPRPRPAAR